MSQSKAPSAWTAADWEQAEQAWRDWRSAISRHHEPSVQQQLERAWAAGFLDSEASFGVRDGNGDNSPLGLAMQIRQPFASQGRTNLRRFQQAVGGVGVISGPETVDGVAWHVWRAQEPGDIEQVWVAIGPYLGPVRFAAFRHALVTPELRAVRSERAEPRGTKKTPSGRSTPPKGRTPAGANGKHLPGGSRRGTAH